MKLVLLIGDAAVGKMTVGQELMKITDLRLFHNHMTIEPVIELFGKYDGRIIRRVREVFFQEFAASDHYGMIFTYLWAFDDPEDWEYIHGIQKIFAPFGTEFCCVELVASEAARKDRNATENRLEHKPSKKDIASSERRMAETTEKHRTVSHDGEVPFAHYLRIDNSDLAPDAVARMIRDRFDL